MTAQLLTGLLCLWLLQIPTPPPTRTPTASPTPPPKYHSISSFTVQITVEPGGILQVSETAVYQFIGGPFNAVSRSIPLQRADQILFRSAQIDYRPAAVGKNPGQVEVNPTNGLKVTWHLEPTSNRTRAVTLVYTVSGAVEVRPDANVLTWQAIPAARAISLQGGRVSIATRARSPVILQSARALSGSAGVNIAQNQANFTVPALLPGQGMTVELVYAAGSLTTTPPAWQTRRDFARRSAPFFLAGGLGLAALGWLAFWWYLRRSGWKGRKAAQEVPGPAQPEMPPAWIAALRSRGDCGWRGRIAALLHLEQRGIFLLKPANEGISRQTAYRLENPRSSQPVLPHEALLLSALFEGDAEQVELAAALQRLTRWSGRFERAVRDELVQAELLDLPRWKARRAVAWAGAGLLVIGILVTAGAAVVLVPRDLWMLLFLPLGVSGAGLGGLGLAGLNNPLTWRGKREARRWGQYRNSLAARLRTPASEQLRFAEWTPYAVALGLDEEWMDACKKQASTEWLGFTRRLFRQVPERHF
ncbi:MAG TPA: DUF2207 domain-containing protein [Anaerolineaceae bacterium]